MNKLFPLLFLLLVSTAIYSQNEIKRDSLLIRSEIMKDSLTIKLNSQENIHGEPIILQESLTNPADIELDKKEIEDRRESEPPNCLSYKLELTPDLKPRRLSSTLSYSLNEYNYNYGIGIYRQGGIEFVYKPLNKLAISMGASAINYNILHSRYKDVVFNFNTIYEFTDWMYLSAFGQYSYNSVNNARFGGFMFAPQTSYGAALKFKTSKKVDFNIGLKRSFNPLTKSWETNGILAPF